MHAHYLQVRRRSDLFRLSFRFVFASFRFLVSLARSIRVASQHWGFKSEQICGERGAFVSVSNLERRLIEHQPQAKFVGVRGAVCHCRTVPCRGGQRSTCTIFMCTVIQHFELEEVHSEPGAWRAVRMLTVVKVEWARWEDSGPFRETQRGLGQVKALACAITSSLLVL